jgi:hypothetical protein
MSSIGIFTIQKPLRLVVVPRRQSRWYLPVLSAFLCSTNAPYAPSLHGTLLWQKTHSRLSFLFPSLYIPDNCTELGRREKEKKNEKKIKARQKGPMTWETSQAPDLPMLPLLSTLFVYSQLMPDKIRLVTNDVFGCGWQE